MKYQAIINQLLDVKGMLVRECEGTKFILEVASSQKHLSRSKSFPIITVQITSNLHQSPVRYFSRPYFASKGLPG